MLVLQGFIVCSTPPLTTEQVMEKQRRRARIREASMQARGADKRANGKKLKKKSNA